MSDDEFLLACGVKPRPQPRVIQMRTPTPDALALRPFEVPTLPAWELRRVLVQEITGKHFGLWRYPDSAGRYVYGLSSSTDRTFPPAGFGGVHLEHLAGILASKRLSRLRGSK